MLTADLVDAKKRNGELQLRTLAPEDREEALALAGHLLETARAHVGRRREELDEAWDARIATVDGKRAKLAAGLRKLVLDACELEAGAGLDPADLRRTLFTHASEARKAHDAFDRDAVLAEVAQSLGVTASAIERGLFADLKSEHLLRAAPTHNAASIVEAWEVGQAQAVLLTAVRITCEVASASAGLVRAFFAKLKFHKLLFSIERPTAERATWRVVIDGPYSMFDAVTKYGLKLALVLPALSSLERWSLVADVRWGKAREPLVFRLDSEKAHRTRADATTHIADDVRELVEAINAQSGPWQAKLSTMLLDVPGAGVCIPDIELTRKGERVLVEVLGFWSRDAVFRRIELAERGLGEKVIFAISSRLRVSAELLDEASAAASLYVYKGKMSPRAILEHAGRLSRGE